MGYSYSFLSLIFNVVLYLSFLALPQKRNKKGLALHLLNFDSLLKKDLDGDPALSRFANKSFGFRHGALISVRFSHFVAEARHPPPQSPSKGGRQIVLRLRSILEGDGVIFVVVGVESVICFG